MKKISIKKMLPGITDEQTKESKVLVGAIKKIRRQVAICCRD